MINTFHIKTKFGKDMTLVAEYSEGEYVSLDGKIWDVDRDHKIYLIGTYKKLDAKSDGTSYKGWRRGRRTYWENKHRVFMGELKYE